MNKLIIILKNRRVLKSNNKNDLLKNYSFQLNKRNFKGHQHQKMFLQVFSKILTLNRVKQKKFFKKEKIYTLN